MEKSNRHTLARAENIEASVLLIAAIGREIAALREQLGIIEAHEPLEP